MWFKSYSGGLGLDCCERAFREEKRKRLKSHGLFYILWVNLKSFVHDV